MTYEFEKIANDALDRLNRAMKRGTGCYLTPAMVEALRVTAIGEMASQPRQDDPLDTITLSEAICKS